jgi:hypothetical protein
MRTRRCRLTGRTGLFILSVLFALFVACQSSASGAVAAPKLGPSHESLVKKEMPKIIPVLEEKIGDRKLVEKSKEKISGMGDREIRLISALCERIPAEESSVSGDIAFFLVTALIVLS